LLEAHRKLLGDIAPIANDLSTVAFGFAEAIFKKYFGELTATRVAEIRDVAKIENLSLPATPVSDRSRSGELANELNKAQGANTASWGFRAPTQAGCGH
jgi:hypothetical protein